MIVRVRLDRFFVVLNQTMVRIHSMMDRQVHRVFVCYFSNSIVRIVVQRKYQKIDSLENQTKEFVALIRSNVVALLAAVMFHSPFHYLLEYQTIRTVNEITRKNTKIVRRRMSN